MNSRSGLYTARDEFRAQNFKKLHSNVVVDYFYSKETWRPSSIFVSLKPRENVAAHRAFHEMHRVQSRFMRVLLIAVCFVTFRDCLGVLEVT